MCRVNHHCACQAVLCLAQMKFRYLYQSAATRTQFFQVQAIKTGHISIIYPQTCGILSVSSKGTVAAKWLMKFRDNFANTAGTNSKIFIVTLFQLYVKDDFNALL